ncbi:MAG: PhoPQ-activated protein PqaA family protein [Myxococcota bacterium]|nr:PhoPQ-activated protein PqaA family protein [Myxococcota bacterium]
MRRASRDGRALLGVAFGLIDCLIDAALATGDLAYDPFLNFAVAQSRILDAAEAVLNAVYADRGSLARVHWQRVWTVGSSKRGHMPRAFAAIDPRAQGSVVAAADLSNLPAFLDLQLAVWSGGYSFSAPEQRPALDTPVGRRYLDCCDPYFWDPEVLGEIPLVIAVGTRDPLYPLAASLTYVAGLPGSTRMLFVPNYGHGHGTIDHVAAFRTLVQRGLAGAPSPRLEASWDLVEGKVTATLRGGEAGLVELWCTTSLGPQNTAVRETNAACEQVAMIPADSPDLRHATWTRHPMASSGPGRWEASPPASELSYPACFVRVETTAGQPLTSGPLLSRALCRAAGLPVE